MTTLGGQNSRPAMSPSCSISKLIVLTQLITIQNQLHLMITASGANFENVGSCVLSSRSQVYTGCRMQYKPWISQERGC